MIPGQALEPLELDLAISLHGKIPRRFGYNGLAAIRDQLSDDEDAMGVLDDLLKERDDIVGKAFDAYYTAYVACCKYIGVDCRDKPEEWSDADAVAFHDKLIVMDNDIYGMVGRSWRSLHVYTGFEWLDHDGTTFAFDIAFIVGCYGHEYRTMYLQIIAKYIISAYEEVFVPIVQI